MPTLKQLLCSDLRRQFDLEGMPERPVTLSSFIIRLFHPRFMPVLLCRAARHAMLRRIPIVPQLLTYINLVVFGIEISPRCGIGPGVFFAHTHGTVIGANAIGSNATVFQGVTLGAKKLDMKFDPALRPWVGDGVTLGSGCKVLGGIILGDNVTVGANSVVLRSVEANCVVTGIPAQVQCSRR